MSSYSDTSREGQYHCAPCCVSSGCTCPQQRKTFDSSFYRTYKQLPGSINGDVVFGRLNRIEPDFDVYGGHVGRMNWGTLHRVYITRSPYGSRRWQDALSIMEGITLIRSSGVWRAVKESTRSHIVTEVVLNIPAHKLNGFGSGLVLGLDAFIKKTDYIEFGHIFSYDNPPPSVRNGGKWQPTREGMLNVQL